MTNHQPRTVQLRKVATVLSIWLVAGSILIFQPEGLFRFTWVKAVVLLLALGAGALAGTRAALPRSVQMMLWAGAAVLGCAALSSADPAASFLGRWPRYEGALMLAVYVGLLALGARLLGGDRSPPWQTLQRALAVAAVLLCLISCLEAGGLRPLGGAGDLRPGATLGNATDQGLVGVLIAGILALPGLTVRRPRDWILVVGLAASVLTVVLSGSRAALLGLVVEAAAIGFLSFRTTRPTWRQSLAVAGGLAAVVALVLSVPAARDRLLAEETVTGRWLLWQQALRLAKDHLWTGVGPSGFVDSVPEYESQQWSAQVGDAFPPDSPHIWLLQALVVGGIPLLILACVLAVLVLRAALTRINEAVSPAQRTNLIGALASVLAYGCGLLTHFTSPGTTGLALFICGGLIGLPVSDGTRLFRGRLKIRLGDPVMSKTSKSATLVAVAAGLVLAVPATVAEWPMNSGAKAARTGETGQAEQQFTFAHQLRPWDSDTALLAAQAFAGAASNGDTEAASRTVEWARMSLSQTPNSVEAGLALSIGYIYLGDLHAAKATLDPLIRRAPYTAGLYVQRGVANFGLAQPEEAIQDLRMAAEQSPSSPLPWQILARVYQRLGDTAQSAAAQARAEGLGGANGK